MRKENSKYVERDGPIRDNDKCSMTCAEYSEEGGSSKFHFDGQVCECVDPSGGPLSVNSYDTLGDCCAAHPDAQECDQCPSGGGGALCPPGQNYPEIQVDNNSFKCCMDVDPRSCNDDVEQGTPACANYWEAARLPDGYGKITQKEALDLGFGNLPSCAGLAPHQHHGGKKGKKKKQPTPSPTPSPVTGQGSNKGGMSGGEIAGIVVGSVAGAILLLLAVGALLRGSGKKGKKK